VQSYETVKNVLIQLRQEQPTGVVDFEQKHPGGSSQSIDKVLGVLLWDIVDQDSDDWEWSKDNNHNYCKIYAVKRN
jgi:hypothetical protein